MNFFAGMTGKSWVIDFEPESVEVVGDEDSVCLLLVDT